MRGVQNPKENISMIIRKKPGLQLIKYDGMNLGYLQALLNITKIKDGSRYLGKYITFEDSIHEQQVTFAIAAGDVIVKSNCFNVLPFVIKSEADPWNAAIKEYLRVWNKTEPAYEAWKYQAGECPPYWIRNLIAKQKFTFIDRIAYYTNTRAVLQISPGSIIINKDPLVVIRLSDFVEKYDILPPDTPITSQK